MSQRRKLRRQHVTAEFVALHRAPENAKHGCEICRGDERRRDLADDLLRKGRLCTVKAQCPDCGAFWRVELFAHGPERSLRLSFLALQRDAPN